jgi:hypothetical protein
MKRSNAPDVQPIAPPNAFLTQTPMSPLRNALGRRRVRRSSARDSDSDDPLVDPEARERNRRAARKWREKQDDYLKELENENDVLRRQALQRSAELECLELANRVLDKELAFFEECMRRIMHPD